MGGFNKSVFIWITGRSPLGLKEHCVSCGIMVTEWVFLMKSNALQRVDKSSI